MTSELSVRLEGISKAYPLFDNPRDRLKQMILGRRWKLYREFWALRNVTLDIRRGETIGIVGRNGSGKSTLLHIIAGTLRPTSGEVTSYGRIAPLLELGTGFNPEFTGRENLLLNAAILGMSREEIRERQEAILDFAEIGDFIDQPVKTYSSGMAARLAFAVAINVAPDILIVDETLAVGDEAFQRKCFARLHEMRATGVTIIFVSHSASSVLELCSRAILLDAGEVLADGAPKNVVETYQRLSFTPSDARSAFRAQMRLLNPEGGAAQPTALPAAMPEVKTDNQASFDPGLKSKSEMEYHRHGAQIENPRIMDAEGRVVNELVAGAHYSFAYDVLFDHPAERVCFGMLLKNIIGVELGGLKSHSSGMGIAAIQAGGRYTVRFNIRADLTPNTYFLNAGVTGLRAGEEIFLHRLIDAVAFRIKPQAHSLVTGYVDFSAAPICEYALETQSEPPRAE